MIPWHLVECFSTLQVQDSLLTGLKYRFSLHTSLGLTLENTNGEGWLVPFQLEARCQLPMSAQPEGVSNCQWSEGLRIQSFKKASPIPAVASHLYQEELDLGIVPADNRHFIPFKCNSQEWFPCLLAWPNKLISAGGRTGYKSSESWIWGLW